jgi:hypothetical protein
MKKRMIHGIKVAVATEIFLSKHLFSIEYVANGVPTTGLALGKDAQEVRDTYEKMSSVKEPLTVGEICLVA